MLINCHKSIYMTHDGLPVKYLELKVQAGFLIIYCLFDLKSTVALYRVKTK